jgi:hypothetical protein
MYAMKNYDNPHCSDMSEFEEDIKRFQYLRKLFGRYRLESQLKERLILNHMIIIYNVFGGNGTQMLFMKLPEYHEYLKPFCEYLNYMPELIVYEGLSIHRDSIVSDEQISLVLKGI